MKKNIFGRLDDIRLGGKFLILFLACVVFPMITSNGYIIYSMKEGMDKQQEQRVGNIADRLEMELASEINRQLFIADYLDRNIDLQEFLGMAYADASAYYEAYVELMENQIIQYYYTAQSVYSIIGVLS